jgi:ATP-dependent DNA helicase RecG
MNSLESRLKELLHRNVNPVPSKVSELDWKAALSEKSERLAQHLSAFANQPGVVIWGTPTYAKRRTLDFNRLKTINQVQK